MTAQGVPCRGSKKCFCHGRACLLGSLCNEGIAYLGDNKNNLKILCQDGSKTTNTAEVLCKELGMIFDRHVASVWNQEGQVLYVIFLLF